MERHLNEKEPIIYIDSLRIREVALQRKIMESAFPAQS